MQIDPKYFNRFIGIMAAVAAVVIVFFTLNNQRNEKSNFKDRILAQDSLKTVYWHTVEDDDSLRISDFNGQFVILNFWANWSDASLESHKKLADIKEAYPDRVEVIAAAVGLEKKEVKSYMNKHPFPFHFVAGSRHFSDFKVPGLPTQLIYNADGKLQDVFLGFPNDSQYDSLRTIITNGPAK